MTRRRALEPGGSGDGKTAVISSGIAYQYAREVFGEVSYLKLGMVHPLPEKLLAGFTRDREKVYVIEEGGAFFETQIKALGIKVTGKEVLPATGRAPFPDCCGRRSLAIAPGMMWKKPRPGRERRRWRSRRGRRFSVRDAHTGGFYVLKKLG